jgi:hypothetical protein
MTPTPIHTVLAWQAAVNQQDAEGLIRLSHPNIEILGPRGVAYGHEILRQWLERAGLSMETQRLFARGDTVVVAQHGIWRDVTQGNVIGEADIASHFRVAENVVQHYARYDTLDEALAAAGLTEVDALPL